MYRKCNSAQDQLSQVYKTLWVPEVLLEQPAETDKANEHEKRLWYSDTHQVHSRQLKLYVQRRRKE